MSSVDRIAKLESRRVASLRRYLLRGDRNFRRPQRNVSVCLSGMIGAKSGVHFSLLSLMEELLLLPGHSLSALPLRTKERKPKGSSKEETGCEVREARERIDVPSGYATFRRVWIEKGCGSCWRLLSGPHFKTWNSHEPSFGSWIMVTCDADFSSRLLSPHTVHCTYT